MYNKNNKSSRLINILVGVIAVLIIIFLIVFLVNKSNSNKTVENDQQFNDNLNLLHQTAKEFFAGQLPDEVGGSLQTSLQELIEMGAIDDLEYGNEKCDTEESYISITKTGKDEYRVKSNLVCPGKSDSTIEKIKSTTTVEDENGNTIIDEDKDQVDLDVEKDKENNNSNDSTVYCKDFKCTVEEIPTTCTVTYEYEYVKRSVSCPNGYNISGSVCTMETSDAKAPTPLYSNPTTTVENAKVNKGEPYKVYVDPITDTTDGTYYCTEGTLQGNKCVVTANKVTSYETKCPAGYNKVGDYCYIYASKTAGSTSSSCPSGYTDNGSNCYYRVPVTTSTNKGSCPSGYTPNGNYCYKYANKTSSTTSSCPAGTSPSGDKCVKKVSAVKTYTPWGNPVSTYSSHTQESTYTHELEKKVLLGKTSIGVSTVYNYAIYRRTTHYTCSQGTLSGTTCLVYSNPVTTSTTPKCPSGYTDNGSNCYIREPLPTSTSTSCPNGYTQSGNYCYTYANKVTNSTPGTCPAGFTDSGSTCYMRIPGSSNPVQYCPSGYSDNGYNCTKTVSAKYASGSTYSKCPAGYTQSGSGKNIQCYKYETSEDKYYCENANAELKGTLCYVKEEAKFLENRCEYGYTLGADNMCHSSSVLTANPTWTDVDYLFSSESYVPGYQRTGRGKFHQVCVRANGTTEEKHWK